MPTREVGASPVPAEKRPPGLPVVAGIFRNPVNVKELVNRSDAVVIATVFEISDTAYVRMVNPDTADAFATRGFPDPVLPMTYYHLAVEEVLLDDGSLGLSGEGATLALSGVHESRSPQIGDRMLFALIGGDDMGIYSLADNWSLIILDGGPIRNFNEHEPRYPGITDEASLKRAVIDAARDHKKLPPSEWPTLFD